MVQQVGELVWGLYILLVRNFFIHSLRSDIHTILNSVAGLHLYIGSLTSSGSARSKVESIGPSVWMMQYREPVLDRQGR